MITNGGAWLLIVFIFACGVIVNFGEQIEKKYKIKRKAYSAKHEAK